MPGFRLPEQPIVQLRISLRDVHPVVWRRLLVPGSVRLAKLDLMLQAAMGWTTRHAPLGLKFAVCLDGQNVCPPEPGSSRS